MTQTDFNALERGDLVRHKMSSDSLVVLTSDSGTEKKIAIRTFTISDPDEWVLVAKANHYKEVKD